MSHTTVESTTIRPEIFTIGHSNHPLEVYLKLLEKHDIDVVVDTRSSPFSKFSPHFNQDSLRIELKKANRKYLFLGQELGGKPKDSSFYDHEGYVLYWKIAETDSFKHAIKRLNNGINSYRVALLCSEENPTGCHRRLLIGRVLQEAGVSLRHIRGSGEVQTEDDLERRNGTATKQMSLLSSASETAPWRSIQSALHKKVLVNSSNH